MSNDFGSRERDSSGISHVIRWRRRIARVPPNWSSRSRPRCLDLHQGTGALGDPTVYRLFRRRDLLGSFIPICRVCSCDAFAFGRSRDRFRIDLHQSSLSDECENFVFSCSCLGAAVNSSRIISTIAVAFLCLSGIFQPAFSHSGVAQDRWNPAHLASLPPQIRAIVQKWEAACGGSLAAAQQFALYLTIPGASFVALHFDDFRCSNKSVQCGDKGCLHEIYVANNGRYRRVLAVYARDIRLLRDHGAAMVEISAANGETRLLRWNGRRFVG
jgi:hypothetical protein